MDFRRFEGDLSSLPEGRQWVTAAARAAGLDSAAVFDLALAFTEAYANLAQHADAPDTGGVDAWAGIHGDCFRVVLEDRGTEFDRAGVASPDLNVAHEAGYGIYLIEELMDVARYERRGSAGTRLVLEKRLAPAPTDRPGQPGPPERSGEA